MPPRLNPPFSQSKKGKSFKKSLENFPCKRPEEAVFCIEWRPPFYARVSNGAQVRKIKNRLLFRTKWGTE